MMSKIEPETKLSGPKKSKLVTFIIGILVLMVGISLPYAFQKVRPQNWGCGNSLLNYDLLNYYFTVYLAIICYGIFLITKRLGLLTCISSIGILVFMGIFSAIVIPNTIRFSVIPQDCEMKLNFGTIYSKEQKFHSQTGQYASTFSDLGWNHKKAKRYCFLLNENEIIKPSTFANCTLPPGIKPFVSKDRFLIVAAGNIDNDATFDVWGIDEKKQLKHLVDDRSNLTLSK